MWIAIVGATGILGRNLLPMLAQHGYDVRVLARDRGKVATSNRVEAEQYDLLAPDTSGQLAGLLSGCEVVMHIATAIPANPTQPGAWEANSRLRTDGTRRLLDAALAAGVTRYVQQSIAMAYPDSGDRWLDEESPLDTVAHAPVVAMEGMVRANDPSQLAWCILRGGLFVGPGTDQDRVIARLRGGREVVACQGQNFMSYIHVADMAAAVVSVIERNPAGQVFNIVDTPLRQGEYLDRLATLVGAPPPPRNPTLPCPPSFRCSNDAAKTALGWQPAHGIWPAS